MTEPAKPIDNMGKERQKGGSVLIIHDNILPRIAATDDMLYGTVEFNA